MFKCLNVKMMEKGLTLIEMMVAVIMFAIIVAAISGLFISSIRSQARILATQEILDQTSYVMEYMGRAIRMARKQTAEEISCLTSNGLNYEIPVGYREGGDPDLGWRIKFINYEGAFCQEFYWDKTTNQLMENRVGDPDYPLSLTSPKLQVNSLKFNLSGKNQADNLQPRVTIFLEIESGRPVVTGSPPKIQIQTSISQRSLDVEY